MFVLGGKRPLFYQQCNARDVQNSVLTVYRVTIKSAQPTTSCLVKKKKKGKEKEKEKKKEEKKRRREKLQSSKFVAFIADISNMIALSCSRVSWPILTVCVGHDSS